jgi:hypothetical protein
MNAAAARFDNGASGGLAVVSKQGVFAVARALFIA